MPIIFEGSPGRVVMVQDALPGSITSLANLQDTNHSPAFDFQRDRVLITSIGISQKGNYQFLHTFGNAVYVYVFGDRSSAVTISGLALSGSCKAGGAGPTHGIVSALTYYDKNKISAQASQARQVEIMIATTVLRGFITGMDAKINDPVFQMVPFELSMTVPPSIPVSLAP